MERQQELYGLVSSMIIDDTTPSLSISLLKEYRNLGIGTELMKQILLTLKEREYKQVSLSVQKINYAVSMYKKVGFEVVRENEEDYVMFCKLQFMVTPGLQI